MTDRVDHLARIVERKARENARRARHLRLRGRVGSRPTVDPSRGPHAIDALRRREPHAPRVIAEIKHRSPSAGEIRARTLGSVQRIARGYEHGGAAAVSVLCDGPGFGGSPLDIRRASQVVSVPLLFKEFVLEPAQVTLARELGASMVLLLVRALSELRLRTLIREVQSQGMAAVVEAADAPELDLALRTDAPIIGVNARDLRSFAVDVEGARGLLARIPSERVAIHMSGITSAADLAAIAGTRADAVLIGEALMRAEQPGERLAQWLAALPRAGA